MQKKSYLGGIKLLTFGKEMSIEDLGCAMMGMLFMTHKTGADDKLARFTQIAMELTCQAIISQRLEEE